MQSNTGPIVLNDICLDFQAKAQDFHRPMAEFLGANSSALELDPNSDMATAYIERIWPDNLPGSLIVSFASFDNFPRYNIRPPVDGPKAASFGARGLTAGFSVYRSRGKLIVDDFHIVPHVHLRPFERYVSAMIHTGSNGSLMSVQDFALMEGIPNQRTHTAEQLTRWIECLQWQRKLVSISQLSFRYFGFRLDNDGLIQFLVKSSPHLTRVARSGIKTMLAAPLSDSKSPDSWQPDPNSRPRFTTVGGVTKVKRVPDGKIPKGFDFDEDHEEIAQLAIIFVRPQLETGQIRNLGKNLIAPEGFLVSSVAGDLKPIESSYRAIKRFMRGSGCNCYLADYLFNIQNAAIPENIYRQSAKDGDTSALHEQQIEAVDKISRAVDICLTQGPPGAGKTVIIVAVTKREVRQNKRVLIVSQTNVAVDNVLSRLSSDPAVRPLRIGTASRVEPESHVFLEENALGTWLLAVRKDCARRIEANSEFNSRLAAAEQAVAHLKAAAAKYEENRKLQKQTAEAFDRTNEQRTQIVDSHKRKHEELSSLKRQKEVLAEFERWLNDPQNSAPDSRLVQDRQLLSLAAASLTTIAGIVTKSMVCSTSQEPRDANLNQSQAGNNGFARFINRFKKVTAQPDEESKGSWKLPYLDSICPDQSLNIMQLLVHCVKAAEHLLPVLEQGVDLCEYVSCSDGACPCDCIEQWSQVCLLVKKHTGIVFNETIPPEIDLLTSSLKPHNEWLMVLNRIKDLCHTLCRECKDVLDATLIKMKTGVKHQISEKTAQLEQIQSQAAEIAVRLDGMDHDVGEIELRLQQIDAEALSYGQTWNEYWPTAFPDLGAEESDIPEIGSDAIAARQQQLMDYRNSLEQQLRRQNSWDALRKDWLRELSKPEICRDSGARRLYSKHANVVGLTCLEAGQRSFYGDEDFRPFDLVIIDEVSKARPDELLMAMMCGRKVALYGDHRQLPPMFRENERSFTEAVEEGVIAKEDFEKYGQLITTSFFAELFYKAHDLIKHSLTGYYRGHPQIMACFNPFYDGQLVAGLGEDLLDQLRQHHLSIKDKAGGWFLEPHQHVLWIDSSTDAGGKRVFEQQVGSSKVNLLEIELVVASLALLGDSLRKRGYGPARKFAVGSQHRSVRLGDFLQAVLPDAPSETLKDIFSRSQVKVNGHTENPDCTLKEADTVEVDCRMQVGVITFYGAQLGHLRNKINHISAKDKTLFEAMNIRTNTVDKFQGMEMPIVIVSLVRAAGKKYAGDFVREYRRINVAFSRARNLLMIIGNEPFFRNAVVDLPDMKTGQIRQVPVYKNIHDIITRFGGRRYARQILKDTR